MTPEPATSRGRRLELAGTLVGALCVLAALAIIWVARLSVHYDLYVSELGAPGMPTAKWFEAALLLIVVGASLIAFAGRDLRSRIRFLALWTPAVSLWIGSGGFLVASQVTCTPGCPVPYGPSFTWQDFIHTTLAVIAFAAACWAMLQVAFARGHRGLATMSLAAAVVVAVVAGAGGILSLAHFQADFGSRLELLATTVALVWLATLGGVLAARLARVRPPHLELPSHALPHHALPHLELPLHEPPLRDLPLHEMKDGA
jgi:hypothetical protein